MSDSFQWYAQLQTMLKQAVQSATRETWLYDSDNNSGMASDILDIEGEFAVDRFEFSADEEELKVYAHVSKDITTLASLRMIIYKVLGFSSEDFLVLVPFYTSEEFQFWFITGYKSHGHTVRIIVRREDHPNIKYDG